MSEYAEKFKDPRWQKKRLEILERDDFSCRVCYDASNTLHVHHCFYSDEYENPWDYPIKSLITLCSDCHEIEHDNWKDANIKLTNAIRSCGFNIHNMQTLSEAFKKSNYNFRWDVSVFSFCTFLSNDKKMNKNHSDYINSLGKKKK